MLRLPLNVNRWVLLSLSGGVINYRQARQTVELSVFGSLDEFLVRRRGFGMRFLHVIIQKQIHRKWHDERDCNSLILLGSF